MAADNISAVAALHQFMTNLHETPQIECMSKFGKQHKPVFRFRCRALGEMVFGTARSKKDAKQEVARVMLEHLSLRGYLVPPEYARPNDINEVKVEVPARSYVVLLNELCEQYRLGTVEYEMLADGDIGPADQPIFTVKASVRQVRRIATAATKRMAHQLAAEQMYKHLRTKQGSAALKNFNEDDAMYRAYEKAIALADKQERAEELQRQIEQEDNKVRKRSKKTQKKKKRSTVRLGLDRQDLPPCVVEMPATSPEQAHDAVSTASAAMLFIERTMERLGL